jgi:hypothetical protein
MFRASLAKIVRFLIVLSSWNQLRRQKILLLKIVTAFSLWVIGFDVNFKLW